MSGFGSLAPVTELRLPEQKKFDGKVFPLALVYDTSTATSAFSDITSLLDWVASRRETLDSLLLEYGAIFFRGFPVHDPKDFDLFVKAFGGEPLEYVGGAAPRTQVVGDVYTANEAPHDKLIPFHHEMAQVPTFPSRLFFFCDVAPSTGGQTPLALSHVVHSAMEAMHPAYVARLEHEGVRYIRVLPDGDDPTSAIGRGWQSTYQTQNKAEAEAKAVAQGTLVEWLLDGCLKTTTALLPAVRVEQRTGRKTWFNSIIAAYQGWQDSRNCAAKAVTFDDGAPMPADVMRDLDQIFKDAAVAVTWQKGDVILVDNRLVLHARNVFTPPRRILASLVK